MSKKKPPSPLRVIPQPKLKVGKSEKTRAAILNATLDFVWSHPFCNMTVGKVMVSTGLSRAAFYPHFNDLHAVMADLLELLQGDILSACDPWISEVGDPAVLMHETIAGLTAICYQNGPFLRAITDAASDDQRFEKDWNQFLNGFDDVACACIEADQAQGLITEFEARPVAIALNRLNASMLIDAFGQHPREEPEPIRMALARIWISTLYGPEWCATGSSKLVRK